MFNISFGIPQFETLGVYFGIPEVVFGIQSFGIPGVYQLNELFTMRIVHLNFELLQNKSADPR